MLARLLSIAALLLLLASRAEAAPINLFLTVTAAGATDSQPLGTLTYWFFEHDTNAWMTVQPPVTDLAFGRIDALPQGVTQFNVSLNVDSLDNVYFKSDWVFPQLPGEDRISVFMAAPAGGFTPGLGNVFGPPWIPLANLGDGLSGNYQLELGYTGGRTGTWALSAADAAPVP